MSIRPWYDVWCDAEDCLQWTSGGYTRREAAEEALKHHWQRVRESSERWYCPAHRTSAYVPAKVKP